MRHTARRRWSEDPEAVEREALQLAQPGLDFEGDIERGTRHTTRAVEMNPYHTEPRFALSMVYSREYQAVHPDPRASHFALAVIANLEPGREDAVSAALAEVKNRDERFAIRTFEKQRSAYYPASKIRDRSKVLRRFGFPEA